MIKIATPISHQFLRKNLAKEIYKLSDCFEARERTSHLRVKNTYLYHIDIDLTAAWNKSVKDYLLKIINLQKKLKLVTFQISSFFLLLLIPLNILYHKSFVLQNSYLNIKYLYPLLLFL